MSNQLQKFELKHIVFVGRTWEDYQNMFLLNEADLTGRKVLDCPGGAAAFTGRAHQLGYDVTACDIAYSFSYEELLSKGLSDLDHVLEAAVHHRVSEEGAQWVRERFGSALQDCMQDMKQPGAQSRYVAGSLPTLPFADGQFDLTLSAHLLFTYADRLSYEWHQQSLAEFMRVTKEEIRLYPLTVMMKNRYEYLERLVVWADEQGWSATEAVAPYRASPFVDTKLESVLTLRRRDALPTNSQAEGGKASVS